MKKVCQICYMPCVVVCLSVCLSVIILNHQTVCVGVRACACHLAVRDRREGSAKSVGSVMLKWGCCSIHSNNIHHMLRGIFFLSFFLWV